MSFVYIALANIIGGSTYAVTTAALKSFPEKDLMFLRMGLCALMFVPLAWRGRRRLAALGGADWARMAAVGLLGYALPLTLGTYGVKLGWFSMTYLAAAGGFLAVILWNVALKNVEASRIANFIFLQPVVGVLLGVTIAGDVLTSWSLAGGALVLSGMWAATRTDVCF